MAAITRLKKALTRRTGNLVVTIREDGIKIRGHRKRTSHDLSWDQVLSLLEDTPPIIQESDEKIGIRLRSKLETPSRSTKCQTPQKAPSKQKPPLSPSYGPATGESAEPGSVTSSTTS